VLQNFTQESSRDSTLDSNDSTSVCTTYYQVDKNFKKENLLTVTL
jgi:hypothetical protein